MSQHCREDGQLADHIQEAYHANRQVYGSPRIHAELRAQGISCSRKRVARLMREQGLCARRRVHRTRTTSSEPGARIAPNLLNQDFTATHPNQKWTGDITAVWTYEGWLYLAAVLDLFSRRVIGWAMGSSQDETLIEAAFRMALLGRHPRAGLLFHSDRGSQYTSDAYRSLLADVGVTTSMSRTGNCYDNAVTESFFATLKGECVERASFQTRGQARQTIFEFVEYTLVAFADTIWKGKRNEALEREIAQQIARRCREETWEVYMKLDDIACELAKDAHDRILWQGKYPL